MKSKFPKKEKLVNKKYFDFLFSNGKSLKYYPIQAIYINFNEPCFSDFEIPNHSEVAFAVPKRQFKKAVDRNKIKRKMREIYRLNKFKIEENFILIFIYKSSQLLDYTRIEKSMLQIFEEINKKTLS